MLEILPYDSAVCNKYSFPSLLFMFRMAKGINSTSCSWVCNPVLGWESKGVAGGLWACLWTEHIHVPLNIGVPMT